MSKSTKVYISDLGDKLFIFEHKQNGILLGEALRREPYEKPVTQAVAEPNAVELIGAYLQEKKMVVDRPRLIDIHLFRIICIKIIAGQFFAPPSVKMERQSALFHVSIFKQPLRFGSNLDGRKEKSCNSDDSYWPCSNNIL
jgi:hypothetical protein